MRRWRCGGRGSHGPNSPRASLRPLSGCAAPRLASRSPADQHRHRPHAGCIPDQRSTPNSQGPRPNLSSRRGRGRALPGANRRIGPVPALPVRGPLPRGGKASCAHALAALGAAASRDGQHDRRQAHRCAGGAAGDADHTDRTRREHRSGRFPAARRRASLQGPRPISTGTVRMPAASRINAQLPRPKAQLVQPAGCGRSGSLETERRQTGLGCQPGADSRCIHGSATTTVAWPRCSQKGAVSASFP